jgi:hypothetical protein
MTSLERRRRGPFILDCGNQGCDWLACAFWSAPHKFGKGGSKRHGRDLAGCCKDDDPGIGENFKIQPKDWRVDPIVLHERLVDGRHMTGL